jgi:hypothetical protein
MLGIEDLAVERAVLVEITEHLESGRLIEAPDLDRVETRSCDQPLDDPVGRLAVTRVEQDGTVG